MARQPQKNQPATQPAVREQRREVAAQPAGGPPAALRDRLRRAAGRGLSKDASDNLVPLVYVLQALSPQVLKKNEKYIEGAEPGMIWLKGGPVVDGETDGIVVQPISFGKCVLEWIPRDAGGGFVARHREMPADAKRREDPRNPNRGRWVMPNGNELQETREHVVIIHGRDDDGRDTGERMPYVVPFSGTNHTASREWMTLMNKKLIDGESAPSYACLYRLRTVYKTNSLGEWYMWNAQDEAWVESDQDIASAEVLYDAFDKGEKRADLYESDAADSPHYGADDGDEDGRP